MGGAVALDFTTDATLVQNYVALFGVNFHLDRVHNSPTGVLPVPGHYINVLGAKALGAVVS